MSLIEWSDEYSVGFLLIDEQHKRLFAIINRLHEASRTGAPGSVVAEVLVELRDYAHVHFTTEEEVMRVYGYSGYREHQAQHRAFERRIAALTEDAERAELKLMNSLMITLKNWINGHILHEDKQYVACLGKDG